MQRRSGGGYFYAAPRLALYPFLTPFSVLAAPLSGAVAVEGQGALNALGMDSSSCGFGRVRSRLEKTIKSTKNAAYHPEIHHSPQSFLFSAASRVAPLPAGRFIAP